jgi:thiol-disulfide isomerase/thioredoxin
MLKRSRATVTIEGVANTLFIPCAVEVKPMGARHRVFRIAMLTCAVTLAGCASSEASREDAETPGTKQSHKSAKVGAPMPSILVKHFDSGGKIDLGSLKGKVVLVDIWASWCGPCKEEMPLLDELAGRLKNKGVEIIAVSVDEDKDSAQDFLSSRPSWALTVAHDPKGKLPEALQPGKMPSSYIVDAQGIIRYVNEGFERGDIKVIEKRLVALAAEAS